MAVPGADDILFVVFAGLLGLLTIFYLMFSSRVIGSVIQLLANVIMLNTGRTVRLGEFAGG